uniref:Uncharacterized protein n=1 Tax=Anguilla anguilla TaxID=7936 RepID=A0A0E9PIL1_ANGAN
MDWIRFILLN